MTMTQSTGDEESCWWVIDHLQDFLHGEMSESDADAFRRHITACESCMDEADMEAAVSRALKRCQRNVAAPVQLRSSVVQMHVSYRQQS
ncbi:zf-HC2 domain-containing protein [Cutibacterium equinum]|uniref:Zf-HC2 domain-containing protein n=1 Tax=Cutibacterium equinum TaxID=3016342 RepID=A0ABY7R1E4_9ACTN|nr:zf-HC2 domain-containing protein [Cutibacterium equinum]WCC81098.1 zf-HC2 domain-containing protein [Cutibacterium equinum]